MKRNIPLACFLTATLGFGSLNAQITVTNSIFPVAGDTLTTIGAADATGFDRELVGADQVWDLTGIPEGITIETFYIDPEEGESADMFPDADLLNKSGNQEIYYRSFNNKIVEIGRSGLDPVLGAINLTFENDGEAVLRRAPMSFGDVYDDASSFSIAAPSSVIPDTILPGVTGIVDSLRLTVETENDDEVDAWGTLMMPERNYDVIRVKRTTTTDAILEVKVPVLGWSTLDASNPLTPLLGDFADLLGASTTTSYQFFTDGEKAILANISYNEEDELTGFQYKADVSTSVGDVYTKPGSVHTYPNPTYGRVSFELQNLPKDNYEILVYNIIGKELWRSPVDPATSRINADLGHLRKGTYLYSVIDSKGRKVTTRRLVIITP